MNCRLKWSRINYGENAVCSLRNLVAIRTGPVRRLVFAIHTRIFWVCAIQLFIHGSSPTLSWHLLFIRDSFYRFASFRFQQLCILLSWFSSAFCFLRGACHSLKHVSVLPVSLHCVISRYCCCHCLSPGGVGTPIWKGRGLPYERGGDACCLT